MAKVERLYHHEQFDCYECLGCKEVMEVPFKAVLKSGHAPDFIRRNPENRMIWLELIEAGHSRCHLFNDVDKARQDRERIHRGQPAWDIRASLQSLKTMQQ